MHHGIRFVLFRVFGHTVQTALDGEAAYAQLSRTLQRMGTVAEIARWELPHLTHGNFRKRLVERDPTVGDTWVRCRDTVYRTAASFLELEVDSRINAARLT